MDRTTTERAVWETRDWGSAAYALSQGLSIRGVTKKEGGEFVFSFDDPESRGDDLKFAFANSAEKKFDEAARTLKKLAYEGRRR